MAGEVSDPKTPSPKKSSRAATLDPIRTSGHGLDPTAAEFNLQVVQLVGNDHIGTVGAPDAGGSASASDPFSQSDGAAQQANADPTATSPRTPPTRAPAPPSAPAPAPAPRSGRKSPFLGARSRVQSPTIAVARRQVAALFHSDEDEDDEGIGASKSPDPGARAAKRIESSNEAEAELYDKCVELQNENAELKKAYDQAKEDSIKLQQQNKTLEKNNEDFQKQILQHKEEDERKAEESKKKQRALGGKDLESENETLRAELANAVSDLNEKHDQVSKLQDANDKLNAEKDVMHEQIDQLHETIATTQEKAKEHNEAQQALNNINSRFEFTFRGLGTGLTLPEYLDHVDVLQQTNRTRRAESQHSTASDLGEPKIGLQRQDTNRQVSGTSVADELTGLDESGSEAGDESAGEADNDGPHDDDPTLTAPADDAFKPFWEEDDNHSSSTETAHLRAEIESLRSQLALQSQQTEEHTTETAHLRAEIEPLRAQLALQSQQTEEHETETANLREEFASLRAQTALQTRQQAEAFTAEKADLKEEIDRLRLHIALQVPIARESTAEIETLQKDLKSLRERLATATEQLNRPPPPPQIIRQPAPSSWTELWTLVPPQVKRSVWAYAVLMVSLVVLVTGLQVYEKYVWWWANTHHQLPDGRGLAGLWYQAMVLLTAESGSGAGLFGWVAWCVPWLWWDVLVGGGG
ncbi:hypothetical protein KC343_g5280 [Hortaea werneckii]|nr:hypothetical protein KC323_g1766 [Hortaea werneckii]KAI7358704.1 hypothetical protein KC320_g946 [Hortaea werneckii]KAI7629341.1 hypothetical protein KC343_g5280 [Hortaea werneckii]